MTKKKEVGRAAGLYDTSKEYSPELDDLRLWEIMNKYENPSYPAPEGEGFDFPLTGTKQNVFDYDIVQKPVAHFGDRSPSAISQGNIRLDTIPMQRGDSESAFKSSQNTEEYRQGLKKEIADLEKQLKDFDEQFSTQVVSHPLFNLAMRRLINNQDATLINAIHSSFENEKNRKSTAAENEKNRQNTLDVAKLNKQEQDAAKKKDLDNAFTSAQQLYNFALEDLEANKNDPKLKREVEKAKELFRQAAVKAERMDDFDNFISATKTSEALWDEAGTAYGVDGQTGIKDYVDSITDPKIKAAIIRDLERSFKITEKDLGYSGAEAKKSEEKAAKAAALKAAIANAIKLGPWDDIKSAEKAQKGLEKNIRDSVEVGYDDNIKKYVLKEKVK